MTQKQSPAAAAPAARPLRHRARPGQRLVRLHQCVTFICCTPPDVEPRIHRPTSVTVPAHLLHYVRKQGDIHPRRWRRWKRVAWERCRCVCVCRHHKVEGIFEWRCGLRCPGETSELGWGVDRRLQPMRWLIGAASSSAGRRFGIPHPGVCSYWQRELNNTELKERRKGRLTSSTVPSVWAQPSATDCPFWRGRADLLTKNTRADFFFFYRRGKAAVVNRARIRLLKSPKCAADKIRSRPSVRVVLPAASVLGAPVTSALLPQQLLQLLCALFSLSLPFFPLRAAVLLPRVDSRVHVHRRMGAL